MTFIPFVPMPLEMAAKRARIFLWLGSKVANLFPNLGLALTQSDMKIKSREYASVAVLASVFWFVLTVGLFAVLKLLFPLPANFLQIMFFTSILITFLSFSYIMTYPNLIVTKKVRDVEKNMLFALRHMLVQIKSGVPLSDALSSVAQGDYGIVSTECLRCIKNVDTGKPLVSELESMAMRTPSLYFRRTLWQLVNSLKAGSDVGNTLQTLVNNISDEHRVQIRQYGSQLNPLALMYMMFAVIVPTLGITFIITISSFSGLQVPQFIFYLILIVLAVFQFMFVGFVKSRRPAIDL